MARKFLFASVTVLIFLGLGEIGARVVEHFIQRTGNGPSVVGWQATFFSSLFDWHEPDPDLLWRFRPNLSVGYIETNEDHLIGKRVPIERDRQAVRILLLGDSSPVGLGLDSYRQSFGEVLRNLLADDLNRPVELVNAAVAGYSSEQIVRFLELRGWGYQPDLVLVYCGNNDASLSGSHSDRHLLEAQRLQALRQLVGRSALYRLLRSMIMSRALMDDSGALTDDLAVRVSPIEFGENLENIATQCQLHGCPLVLIRPAVPRKWPAGLQFKVFQEVTGADGALILPASMRAALGRPVKYCIDWEDFVQRHGDADRFTRAVYGSAYTDTISGDRAVARYRSELGGDPDNAVAMNNLGVSYFEADQLDSALLWIARARHQYSDRLAPEAGPRERSAGAVFLYNEGITALRSATTTIDSTAAIALLDSALWADYFSLRIKQPYLDQIDRVAEMFDGAYVSDVAHAFSPDADNPLSAETMFIDHCHPTAEGHWLIARKLAQLVVDRQLLAQ